MEEITAAGRTLFLKRHVLCNGLCCVFHRGIFTLKPNGFGNRCE